MELEDLLSVAWYNGLGSHHDCKTNKQFEEDKQNFFDDYEAEIKALNMRIVGSRRKLLVKFSQHIQKYKNKGLDYDCVEREIDSFLNQ